MSRCFPFPPPGYAREGASGVSLIDSIKLQKEKEKAQTDRKKEPKIEKNHPKTEKKESRKDRKEKKDKKTDKKEKKREKHGDRSDSKTKRISEIFPEVKKSQVESKEKNPQKKPEDVVEQLEKSCLTEELEQLNSTNLCYSSDGTQSGEKRKRDSLPSTSNQSNGSIIRIRMPIGKQKEAVAPLSQRQPFAKSVKANPSDTTLLPIQKQYAPTSAATNAVNEVTRQPDSDLLPSTSGRNESLLADNLETSLKSKSVNRKLLKKESIYKALTENWLPIPLIHEQVDADDDDQDWLFKSNRQDNQAAKRLKACSDTPFQDSCSYGPRACFLPEADIYALPYVIPF